MPKDLGEIVILHDDKSNTVCKYIFGERWKVEIGKSAPIITSKDKYHLPTDHKTTFVSVTPILQFHFAWK